MLRLISIIGIAIAMVVGFVAISTQMKDDYSVRSRVVDVLKQMKNVAADELQCESDNVQSSQAAQVPDTPMVEMKSEPEITPLADEQNQNTQQETDSGNETLQQQSATPTSDSDDTAANQDIAADDLQQTEIGRNADIVQAMGYRALDNSVIEVITVFNNVKGDSGKIHVKSGSRVVIHCSCVSAEISCKTAASNINKNYLPKKLTRQ